MKYRLGLSLKTTCHDVISLLQFRSPFYLGQQKLCGLIHGDLGLGSKSLIFCLCELNTTYFASVKCDNNPTS